MKIHDVSLVIRPGMATWKNEAGPKIEPLRRLSKGDGANVSLLSFGNHTGTHVDPPSHFIDGGNTSDKLPVDALVGPCRVVGYDGDTHISAEWLDGAAIPETTERLLFKTRNSDLWNGGAPFHEGFIALDASGAKWCARRGMKLVGVDYLSVEPYGTGPRAHPVHLALLKKNVVIIEGLDMSDVAPGEYELVCGAIKVENGDGAPARVFLIER